MNIITLQTEYLEQAIEFIIHLRKTYNKHNKFILCNNNLQKLIELKIEGIWKNEIYCLLALEGEKINGIGWCDILEAKESDFYHPDYYASSEIHTINKETYISILKGLEKWAKKQNVLRHIIGTYKITHYDKYYRKLAYKPNMWEWYLPNIFIMPYPVRNVSGIKVRPARIDDLDS